MRIAHVITRFIRGGADENTLLSCNAQAAAGHEVLLIHGDEAAQGIIDRLDPGVQRAVSPSLVRSLRPAAEVRAVAEIAGRLKAFRPHIVHTHTSKAGVLGRLAARMVGTPGVVHGVHIAPFLNVGFGERAVYLLAERMLAPMTDMFVNVSEGMRRACLDHGVGDVAKHVVVPSGMDVEAFRSARPLSRPELAERLGVALPADLKLLLIVAGFEPRKRQAEFLEVFARLAARHPQARLVLLGEGAGREALVQHIEALGLGGAVFLPGFQKDVERWIAAADICVLTSEREGLPRVVVQYALAGRPVVVSALPGVEQVVEHGTTGFVIPLDSVQAAEEPLETMLSHPSVIDRMSRAARALDLSAWSVDAMVRDLDDVYRRVLGRKKVKAA